jgi:exopolysaccharide biosynthesis polyprenyl glycosylphosphotransferase
LRTRFYAAVTLLDAFVIAAGFTVVGFARFGDPMATPVLMTIALILPLFMALNVPALNASALCDWRAGATRACWSLLVAAGIILFVAFALKASNGLSRIMMMAGLGVSMGLMLACRAALGRWCDRVFDGSPMSQLLIVDGVEVETPPHVHRLDAAGLGLAAERGDPFSLDRLARHIHGFDGVFLACRPDQRAAWATALRGSDVRVELLVPELDAVGALGCEHFAGNATILVSNPLRQRDNLLKRGLDLVLAIIALTFLGPLLLLVALVIKLDSRGPVFFVQQRVGRGNRLFNVLKFRSMRTDACDEAGNQSTLRGDSRVTRVGRFIRATSIDELPQLLNILRGEMSFVGPRPHAIGSLAGDELFWQVDERYSHRHACKPGLTGLAQVRGYRGATHRREDLVNRLQSDLEYVNGWSVRRDLSILLGTFKVLVHRNAY